MNHPNCAPIFKNRVAIRVQHEAWVIDRVDFFYPFFEYVGSWNIIAKSHVIIVGVRHL